MNYGMIATWCAIMYPWCFTSYSCISGGTKVGYMFEQEYLEGQTSKNDFKY